MRLLQTLPTLCSPATSHSPPVRTNKQTQKWAESFQGKSETKQNQSGSDPDWWLVEIEAPVAGRLPEPQAPPCEVLVPWAPIPPCPWHTQCHRTQRAALSRVVLKRPQLVTGLRPGLPALGDTSPRGPPRGGLRPSSGLVPCTAGTTFCSVSGSGSLGHRKRGQMPGVPTHRSGVPGPGAVDNRYSHCRKRRGSSGASGRRGSSSPCTLLASRTLPHSGRSLLRTFHAPRIPRGSYRLVLPSPLLAFA